MRCVIIKATITLEKSMSRIEKMLLRGAAFTVLFILIYFALAAIMGIEGVTVGAGRFFLILLFAYILAMADFVFEGIERMNIWLKRLCIYVISMLAFFFIFILGGNMKTTGGAIFAALIIFTAVYSVGLGTVLLVKRTVSKNTKPKSSKEKSKKPYKSLYGD